MAREDYETVTLVWEGREIELSYQANWLNSGQWHLELRSADPLPVTQTGYRSAFAAYDLIPDADASASVEAQAEPIVAYVRAWLDQAALDPAWMRFLEDSRQLKLF